MFRANTLLNNDEKLRSQAAGSFVSSSTSPTFNRPDSHAVMKMIKISLDVRKHQLVTFSKVKGILAIYKNRVASLNLPHIENYHLNDEDENIPLITSALGLEVTKAYPAYFSLKETTSDFFFLGNEQDATFFWG